MEYIIIILMLVLSIVGYISYLSYASQQFNSSDIIPVDEDSQNTVSITTDFEEVK